MSCGCHSSSFRTLVSNGPVHRVHRMTSVGSPRSRSTSAGRAVTVSAVPSSVHSHVLLGSQLGLKEMQKACSLSLSWSSCRSYTPGLAWTCTNTSAQLGELLTPQPPLPCCPYFQEAGCAAPFLTPRCSSGITACAPAQANHVSQLYTFLVTTEVESLLSL